MNVTKLEFWTDEYEGLSKKHFELSLNQVDQTQKYILKDASGLDPGEVATKFYKSVTVSKNRYTPKELYYDLKLPNRFVVFKIKLNPNYAAGETPQTLRNDLYRMIAYHRGGDVRIKFVEADASEFGILNGFVERFESDLFSSDPTVTIGFRCINPLIRASEWTIIDNPANAIEIDDDPSTAPHGFEIRIKIDNPIDTPAIFQFKGIADEEVANFTLYYEFEDNDYLVIKSDPSDRQIYVERGMLLTKTYLMDRVAIGSVWPMMFPGENNFLIYGEATLTVDYLRYYTAYWGL